MTIGWIIWTYEGDAGCYIPQDGYGVFLNKEDVEKILAKFPSGGRKKPIIEEIEIHANLESFKQSHPWMMS